MPLHIRGPQGADWFAVHFDIRDHGDFRWDSLELTALAGYGAWGRHCQFTEVPRESHMIVKTQAYLATYREDEMIVPGLPDRRHFLRTQRYAHINSAHLNPKRTATWYDFHGL